MRTHWIAPVALVAAMTLVGAACGDTTVLSPGASAAPGTTAAPASTTTTTTTPATTTTSTTSTPTTVAPTTTDAPQPEPTTGATTGTTQPGLPGEPWDNGPQAGERLGVVGVAFDDVLNVRARPGAGERIVTTLEPQAVGVVATGTARLLAGHSIWLQVEAGGTTGWAAAAFLSRQGGTVDSTASFLALLGERPAAPTMLELGTIVANAIASVDPGSRIVVVARPQAGHDIGEVVLDVLGFGDDSVSGARLHVFGQLNTAGDTFSLRNLEETPFCYRGVTLDGICV